MANPVEVLPLLLVAVLMLSAGGADVDSLAVTVDGDHTVTDPDGVVIVGGGNLTVPADASVDGPLYVAGGNVTLDGTVDGDVVQLAGTLSVTDGGTITDELRLFGGTRTLAAGADVDRVTDFPATVSTERSPVDRAVWLLLQALVLGLLGYLAGRRWPELLANVGDSITEHALVSGTIGLLASVTGVALLVFMALTLILLPVSVVGLGVGFLVGVYAYVAFGYLLGQRLPVASRARATALGSVAFVVAVNLVALVPLVGMLVQLLVVLTGIGAVLITYFGLREFEPVTLPD